MITMENILAKRAEENLQRQMAEALGMRMDINFIRELNASELLKYWVDKIKKTRITELTYNMGVYGVKMVGGPEKVDYEYCDTDLEDMWNMEGINQEEDEEPTERLFQPELDMLNELASLIENSDLFCKTFFYEFVEVLNKALLPKPKQ